MRLSISTELRDLIPPLTDGERAALRESLLRERRALDPIKVWLRKGDLPAVILDGHNRFDLCNELALPYEVVTVPGITNEADAREWIFNHQRARRSLSQLQLLALAITRGLPPAPENTPEEVSVVTEACAKGMGPDIIANRIKTFRQVSNRVRPRPRKPRPPRGPSGPAPTHHIPEGHELKGVSTLRGPDGEVHSAWDKTGVATADEAPNPITPEGHTTRKTSTYLRGDGTVIGQWISTSPDDDAREKAFREAWARHASIYKGAAGVAPAPAHDVEADLLTVYPLGDPHIGMLAWAPETGDHFDTKIACRELLACVKLMVDSAPASVNGIITNLGDFMHAQSDDARTPGHGHQLDTDGRFAKSLDMGHALLRGIVDTALTKHSHVTVRNLPGNHDPRVAAELAMWLRAVYEDDPRVDIADPYAAQQYDVFGQTLIGWHHGDRAKPRELPALMAVDRAQDWGRTLYHVWHTGHVHHLTRDETPGCVVESHRTMAARDAYHAGRYRAGRSLQAITYHKEYGETSRVTIGLERVRAAIAARKGGDK